MSIEANQAQESQIILLLRQEEGVRQSPYLDSLGYPTIGVGFRLGPQGASLSNYLFTLENTTIDAWLSDIVKNVNSGMLAHEDISMAMAVCNMPRRDILTSMAYQMGISGLGKFRHMLAFIQAENWDEAASQMLDSTWAKQTPQRAQRHASVMRSGKWEPAYNSFSKSSQSGL
ncbi:glycoside hydrolase family protein [Citrobacter amalonaticus]|uniref:glycoside hydrolase family protein n=1 Tax=Citrobacter amalonaticus TaxID=35703 RepID=UPI00300D8A84